jgi:hypothetical protein
MFRCPDQQISRIQRRLNHLVEWVARADEGALARPCQALASAVADRPHPTVPDPADAVAVISPTFVGLWLRAGTVDLP